MKDKESNSRLLSLVSTVFIFAAMAAAIFCAARFAFIVGPYQYSWVLPVSFSCAHATFLSRAMQSSRAPIVSILTTVLFFLSSVIYPSMLAIVGQPAREAIYIPVMASDVEISILLIAYSQFCGAMMLGFLTRERAEPVHPVLTRRVVGNSMVYIAIIGLCALLIFSGRLPSDAMGFAFLKGNQVERGDVALTIFELLARQIIVIGTALLFLLTMQWASSRNRLRPHFAYLAVALVAGAILTSLVVGDRRSVQLFTGLAVVLLLGQNFPRYRKLVAGVIIAVMIAVFLLMTTRRIGSADGIFSASDLSTKLRYLQVYFGGIDSVATNVSFSNFVTLDLYNLFFDFARLTFGLNFFVEHSKAITSEIYNNFLYNGKHETGQLLFASGYGYIYFGVILSPLVVLLNISLAYIFEQLYRRTTSLEAAYLYLYCLFRIASNILINTPTVLSVVTMQLGTFGLVILLARLLATKRVRLA